VREFQLAPASGYRFQFGSSMIADFSFTVTDKGNVEYDDDCRSFLDGFGTPNLTVKGLLVTLDALRLTGADRTRPATGVLLVNTQLHSDILPTDWIAFRNDIRLLPAKSCGVQVGSGLVTSFAFDLKRDGTFHYNPAFDSSQGGFLSGQGTSTLTFLGYPLTVDTTGVGDLLFIFVNNFPQALPGKTDVVLLPCKRYPMEITSGQPVFSFNVELDSKITFNPSLNDSLKVADEGGKPVLRVLGVPASDPVNQLTLPFVESGDTPSPLFSLTNTGAGPVVSGTNKSDNAIGFIAGKDPGNQQDAGVYGESDQQGVMGMTTSPSGTGVYGGGLNPAGSQIGVRGETKTGVGVQGQSFGTGLAGNFIGNLQVSGNTKTSHLDATNIEIFATTKTSHLDANTVSVTNIGEGVAIRGEELGFGFGFISGEDPVLHVNDGVYGESPDNGVVGRTHSTSASGVFGHNTSTGNGVAGFGEQGIGVHGFTESGVAVEGDNRGTGLAGKFLGSVIVVTPTGTAVAADSTKGDGMGARTQSSAKSGIFAHNDDTQPAPVGTAGGNGVFGLTTVPNASGVFGANNNGGVGVAGTSDKGIGIFGRGQTAGRFEGDVTVTGTQTVKALTITGGADVAESFRMSTPKIPQGSVVVIDDTHEGGLKLSDQAYDPRVAGVVSGAGGIRPGVALQQESGFESGQNVALSGRVYVLADASENPIAPGDLLTTSDTPGHAMKVTDHARAQGAIIGKAMSAMKEGKGLVLVLVSLQ
jgi:hypothetical protein